MENARRRCTTCRNGHQGREWDRKERRERERRCAGNTAGRLRRFALALFRPSVYFLVDVSRVLLPLADIAPMAGQPFLLACIYGCETGAIFLRAQ